MIKQNKINIVLFWFMDDWGKYGRSYEKIAETLCTLPGVGKVLCVFPPQKIAQGYHRLPFSYAKLSQKLSLLTPNDQIIYAPSERFRFRKWLNVIVPDLSLKISLWFLGFKKKNTAMWVFPPHEYIDRLTVIVSHRLLITHVVDNNTFLENISEKKRASIKSQYEKLVVKSDLTITSSKLNYDLFSPLNSRCYICESAVDAIFISAPSRLPSKVNKVRPRIGYIGAISQRTDIDLLYYIARARPQYDIIIAGFLEDDNILNKHDILKASNVHYEGVISYKDLPDYIRQIDVCLIPHKDTAYCRSMSPLKLFQYMASGRPVVSTSLDYLMRFCEHISIANDYDDFIDKVDRALMNDDLEISSQRIAAIKSETWEKRVGDMFAILSKHLDEKNKQRSKHG